MHDRAISANRPRMHGHVTQKPPLCIKSSIHKGGLALALASVARRSSPPPVLVELGPVGAADLLDGAVHALLALLDPDGAGADALDLLDGVADKEHRHAAAVDEGLDAGLALLLEEDVATERVSSTMRTSGSVTVAMAKAIRATMPLE